MPGARPAQTGPAHPPGPLQTPRHGSGHRLPAPAQPCNRPRLPGWPRETGCSAHKTCSLPALAGAAKPTWPVPWDTMPACTVTRPAITACRACCLHSPRPRPTAVTTNCWLRPLKSGYCSSMIGAWRHSPRPSAMTSWRIIDDRHGAASTVMVSQLPVDQWYVTVGDNTLADALLDRLIHNAHRLALKGESMRKKMVQLTEREHLS